MNSSELYIVQRLPEYYQWRFNAIGKQVELFSGADKRLVGFKLLNASAGNIGNNLRLMDKLSVQLNDMAIGNSVLMIDGNPCLFVQEYDSSVVLRLFKNMGVVIADETH